MLPEAVAYEVTRLLHDNITEGTGTAAYTGCAGQAGKTGTTDDYTDAWFAGYQPNLATAVWVGYPESNDDRNDQRPRDHRLRRHLPGRNLALALLRTAESPARNSASRRSRSAGRPTTASFTQAAPATRPARRRRQRRAAEPPGSAAVGGYDPSEYDPDAYAPGAGQEPTPRRRPPPPADRRSAAAESGARTATEGGS